MFRAACLAALFVSLALCPAFAGSQETPHPAASPWLVAGEIVAINLAVWAIPHYAWGPAYTHISWETMRENFRDGFEWDRSRYFVNFYHHPYHGYLYFNCGRANGFGYWGSALAAFCGSLMWELVMENNRPSINDLVTTTAGGCVFGEIGYRFSALLRAGGGSGIGRFLRRSLAAVLDPVGRANRLIGRRSGGPTPPQPNGAAGSAARGEVVLAGPVIARSDGFGGGRAAPTLCFAVDYGDPSGSGWSGRPFDLFSVRGRMRWGPDRPHLSLFLHGALLGKRLGAGNGRSHFLGLYQHYEYYGIDTLRVCGTSFTGGWSSRLRLSRGLGLAASARLGVLALGGSDDFYNDSGERRSYNFGTGWTWAAEASLAARGHAWLSAAWRHYRLRALAVSGGRAGRESWDVLHAQLNVPVGGGLGAGIMAEHCSRRFAFQDHPPGRRRLTEVRAFAALRF